MDKNKLKSEKIALIVVIILFAGILSYGLIISNPTPTPVSVDLILDKTTPTPVSIPGCPSTVTDIDGNIYKTVLIGSQCWMKENLKVTKDPIGKPITRQCYKEDPNICETDGGLYSWWTAMNNSVKEGTQGICPDGWHIPKDSEWYTLENGLAVGTCNADRTGSQNADCDQAGARLKQGGDSGFEGILAGHQSNLGTSSYRGMYAQFWSSTIGIRINLNTSAWSRYLISNSNTIERHADNDAMGHFSIRCLKD